MKNWGEKRMFLIPIIFLIFIISISCNLIASDKIISDLANNSAGHTTGDSAGEQIFQEENRTHDGEGSSQKNETIKPYEQDQTQDQNPEILNTFPDNVIPYFVFNHHDLYVIDYEKSRYSRNENAIIINQKFAVDWGDPRIYDTRSGEIISKINWNNCEEPLYYNLSENFLIIICTFEEQPELNKIQAWDLSKNSFLGEITLGPNGIQYQYFASSPNEDRFLISAIGYPSKLFTISPFQEISLDNRAEIQGELVSSPDKQFFISKFGYINLWKWTENGVEIIDTGIGTPYPNLLSVSPNAELLVYSDYENGKSGLGTANIKVFDRITKQEIFNVLEKNLMVGGFIVDEAALSPDGKYLFVNGIKEVGSYEYFVIVINIDSVSVEHSFALRNGVPNKLRIEYLPVSIRNSWSWEGY